jgi:NADH:ubiquinone oxidoreductase subunit E
MMDRKQNAKASRSISGLSAFGRGIVPAFAPPPLPSSDKRWKIVNDPMRKNEFARSALIETLHTVQSSFGFVESNTIRFVAQYLRQRNR